MQLLTGLILLAAIFGSPPLWAEPGQIRLTIEVVQEVEVVDETGDLRIELIEPTAILPGDEVIYIIRYRNEGEAPAERIAITNAIPGHMRYQEGTAAGAATEVRYSVDDGASFDVPGESTVTSPQGETRPAEPSDYTHIRWLLLEAVPPGAGGQVSYRARLD